MAAEDVEETDLEALRSAALATVKTASVLQKDKVDAVENEDDEDLEALRQAALLSRKSVPQTLQKENLSPSHHFRQHPFFAKRRPFPHRLHRGPFLGPKKFPQRNPRSNLIVINTLPLDGDTSERDSKSEDSTPTLLRPQDKWCPIGDELSSSPKHSEPKHKGPEKFNRCESDSDSEESDDDDQNGNDSGSRMSGSGPSWQSTSDSEDDLKIHAEELLSDTGDDTQFTVTEETSDWDARAETPVQDERPTTGSCESGDDAPGHLADSENSACDRPASLSHSDIVLLSDKGLSEEVLPPTKEVMNSVSLAASKTAQHNQDEKDDSDRGSSVSVNDDKEEGVDSNNDANKNAFRDKASSDNGDCEGSVEGDRTSILSELLPSDDDSSEESDKSEHPSDGDQEVLRKKYACQSRKRSKELYNRRNNSWLSSEHAKNKQTNLELSDLRHQLERRKRQDKQQREKAAESTRLNSQSQNRSPQLKSVLSVVKKPDYFKTSSCDGRKRRSTYDKTHGSNARHLSPVKKSQNRKSSTGTVEKDRVKADKPIRRVFLASNENEKSGYNEDQYHDAVNVTVKGVQSVDGHLDGKARKKRPVHMRLGLTKMPHKVTDSSNPEDGNSSEKEKNANLRQRERSATRSSILKTTRLSKLSSLSVCVNAGGSSRSASENRPEFGEDELRRQEKNQFRGRLSDKRIRRGLKRSRSGDEQEPVGWMPKSSRKSRM